MDSTCADLCHLLGESNMHQQWGKASPRASGETQCGEVWEGGQITFSLLSKLSEKVGSRVGKVGSSDP